MYRRDRSSKSGRQDGKEAEGRGQTKRGRGGDDDGWGGFRNYMDAKKSKLNDQFDQDNKGKSSNIFSGVYIYVNGYTRPSSDELKRIMQHHGGRYETYLSKTRVTHIIASNLPNSKFKMAKTMPIVKPDWITDSVSAGRRLSHVPYLLLGNQSKLQPGLKSFPSVSSLHKSSSTASSYSVHNVAPMPTVFAVTSAATSTTSSIVERQFDSGIESDKHGQLESLTLKIRKENVSKDFGNFNYPIENAENDVYKGNNLLNLNKKQIIESNAQDLSLETSKSACKKDCEKIEEMDGHESNSEDDIVYNSDGGDNEIIYNSEEDSPSISRLDTKLDSCSRIASLPVKHGRVYALKKTIMSKSGSFDSLKSDTSSCDGFSDCLPLEQAASSKLGSFISGPSVSKFEPSLSNTFNPRETTHAPVSSLNLRPVAGSLTAKLYEPQSDEIEGIQNLISATSKSLVPKESSKHVASLNDTIHEATENISPTVNCSKTLSTDKNIQPEIGQPSASRLHYACKNDSKLPAVLGCETPSVKLPPDKSSKNNMESTPSVNLPPDKSSKNNTESTPSVNLLQDKSSKDITKSTSEMSPDKSAAQFSATTSNQRQPGMMARAGDKGFLEEYYSNSRLHHLSTWGAEFKAYVSEIQRSGSTTFPGRQRLRQVHVEAMTRLGLSETLDSARHARSSRVVMHIDMDCFFVSVGLLSRPDLKGKPVAVTHSKGQRAKSVPASDLAWEQLEWQKKRGGKLKAEKQAGRAVAFDFDNYEGAEKEQPVGYDFLVPQGSTGSQTFHSMAELASCSYEARKAGVKNGMFMGRAMSLSPDLQTIPYNFAEYNRISKILYDLVASYTHDIEAVSCDEMLIDCTDLLTDTGATAMEFASLLRSEMMEKTGCPASAGIGPNVLLAKLATRKAKPNGQFEVLETEAKKFIEDQPVSDLPGVGYSMTRKLSKLNVQTCGELQRVPVSTLCREFGPKTGEGLHRFSLGQDDRPVKGDKQRKSVSAEVNYGIRFSKELDALTFLKELCGEVKRRLDAIHVKGRCITLKLMIRRSDAPPETAKFMGHGICNTFNKSTNLPVGTNNEDLIAREVISLYKAQKVVAADVRGIGIQINKLEGSSSATPKTSTIKGHQSILNFAIPSTSKTNLAETLHDSENKEAGDRKNHIRQADAPKEEETINDTRPRTSTSVPGSMNKFTPSLFSSTSSAASSSSSNALNSLKNGSVSHGNSMNKKYATQAKSKSYFGFFTGMQDF